MSGKLTLTAGILFIVKGSRGWETRNILIYSVQVDTESVYCV